MEYRKLGEVATITKLAGFEFSKHIKYTDDGEVIAIRGLNVKHGTLILNDVKRINKEVSDSLERSKLREDDIVFTYTGTIGNSSIIKENNKYHLAPNVAKITISNLYNPYFYYLYFQTSEFLQAVEKFSVGSTQQTIPMKSIRLIPVPTPPKRFQDSVSNTLYDINYKIELNNAIIANLEELSQTLFKRWFVDFEFPDENGNPYKSSGGEMYNSTIGEIPINWGITSIKEKTSKFTTGLNPRKNFVLGEGTNYYVTIKNMANNDIILDEKCAKVTNEALNIINKRSNLRKGDILFSGIGTIGRTYLIFEDPKIWNISESIFSLRPTKDIGSIYLYLLLLSDTLQNYSKQLASGSVQKGIRKKDLEKFEFPFSNQDIEKKFEEVVFPMVLKIQNLREENIRLVSLRDTLLPKLMSGEIELPDNLEVTEDAELLQRG